MAYVPGSPFDEEKNKNQPTEDAVGAVPMTGGAGGGGASMMSQAPLSAVRGPAPATGSGFINLDRYLAANQGIDKPVAEKGMKTYLELQGAVTGEGAKKQEGINSQKAMTGDTMAIIDAAASGDAKAEEQANQILSQQFTPIDTTVSADKAKVDSLASMSNTDTVGLELSKQAGYTEGNYTPQMSALDQMLYGNLAGEATADNAKRGKTVADTVSGINTTLAENATKKQQEIEAAREGFRGQASDYAKNRIKQAEDEAQKLREQQRAQEDEWQRAGVGTTQDVVSGRVSAGGTMTQAERAKLDYISQLLGDQNLASPESSGLITKTKRTKKQGITQQDLDAAQRAAEIAADPRLNYKPNETDKKILLSGKTLADWTSEFDALESQYYNELVSSGVAPEVAVGAVRNRFGNHQLGGL